MRIQLSAFAAVACMSVFGTTSNAATFDGFFTTGNVYFDDAAAFDYDPFLLGGSIFDFGGLVNVVLSTGLGSGSLLLTDDLATTVLDGSLSDFSLSVDNDIADDTFSMLFDLETGPTDFAIATFTGDLDGFGFTNFFTDGVLFADGTLRVEGAAVIPLPAGLPLLLTGVGGLLLIRRQRAKSKTA